ncbi:MAG: glycosyltransferase family 39 protein [Candidatus Coatesbacteria bacterium]|nr:glycosyltransferase family 39 protein [Candidatus Coatesbacteria bacterium]
MPRKISGTDSVPLTARIKSRIRLPLMILVGGMILYSAVILSVVRPSFPTDVDSARYLMLCRNIISGDGYMDDYKPWPVPHMKFPPVLPCLLAVTEWFFPGNIVSLKLTVALLGLASLIVAFLLFRYILGELLASIAVVTLAIQFSFLLRAQRIMSDVPYTLFSMLALLLVFTRFREERPGIWFDIGVGLAVAVSILTRSIGIALPPAIVGAALLKPGIHRKGRLITIVLVASIISGVGWEVHNTLAADKFVPVYPTLLVYKDSNSAGAGLANASDILKRVEQNFEFHYEHLLRVALPNVSQIPYLLSVFSLLAVFGWLVRLIRKRSVLEFYLLIYMLVLLVWPWAVERFLTPVVPLFLLYFIDGLRRLTGLIYRGFERLIALLKAGARLPSRRRKALPNPIALVIIVLIFVVSLIVPGSLLFSRQSRERFNRPPPDFPEFLSAVNWIARHTPEDAVVLTERAVACNLISDRKSFTARDVRASGMLREAVSENNLFIIHSTRGDFRTASPLVASVLGKTEGHWRVVFRSGSTLVIAQNGAEVIQGES